MEFVNLALSLKDSNLSTILSALKDRNFVKMLIYMVLAISVLMDFNLIKTENAFLQLKIHVLKNSMKKNKVHVLQVR